MEKLEHLLSHWNDYQLADMAGELSKEERDYLMVVENYIRGGSEFPVLELHYLENKKYRVIAHELGYSERDIYRHRKKQIERLHYMIVGSWRYNNG